MGFSARSLATPRAARAAVTEPYGGTLSGFVPVGTKAFYVLHGENGKSDFSNDSLC